MNKALSIVVAIAFSWGLLYSVLHISTLFYYPLLLMLWVLAFLYLSGIWRETHFFWKNVLVVGSIAAIISMGEVIDEPLVLLLFGFILGGIWYGRYSKDQREEGRREKAERHSKKNHEEKV